MIVSEYIDRAKTGTNENRSAFQQMIKDSDKKEFFIEALKLEPKLLIDYVIKEIRVYEYKLEIIFNSPIKRSPDANQVFFFSLLIPNCH